MKAQIKFKSPHFRQQLFFGGSYCTRRRHRVARPLSTRHPLHLVLKSSKARGELSFWRKRNKGYIDATLRRFATKFGVKVIDCVNVGNHLHMILKFSNRFTYTPFIRAFTAAVKIHVAGVDSGGFWDFRPYSRVVVGWTGLLRAKDYMAINRLESLGYRRDIARRLVGRAGESGINDFAPVEDA